MKAGVEQFSSGKATVWTNREPAVFDLFSNLKWVRSNGFFGALFSLFFVELFQYEIFNAMVSIGFDTMRSPRSALNVKVLRNSRHARENGRSNYESQKCSHVCSECQSNGNRKQAWVNCGRSHDSLKLASALTVKVNGRCSSWVLARGGEHEGRLRIDEEVLDARGELRQPVVGVGGTEEEQGRERLTF